MKGIRKKLGLTGQLKIFFKIARIWGVPGLRDVWESQRTFQSKHTGYGIIAGRKSSIGRLEGTVTAAALIFDQSKGAT
jgi:hypothetical protein